MFLIQNIRLNYLLSIPYCKSISQRLSLLELKYHIVSLQFFVTVVNMQGIVKRDEVVFKAARSRGIPILMVTSGGYQKRTARIIADSILNLHNLGLIDKELATSEAESPKVEQMIRDSVTDLTNLTCSDG